ncbi:mitochondrial ribosomal protein L27-domain-containing protein [Myxozyma melibiosi]|uniref:Mitochondrial ribosomal protein L27-domain-containing protein n=1 Tax=Myxozyma melibiosi TaxID=54550 RepID=A0ABR1F5A9_9ASCO
MKPSTPLAGPWKHFRDRLIPIHPRWHANRRKPVTTKRGNKDFYKGTGSANMGRHTKHGGYIIDYQKVRTYVVPDELVTTNLAPYLPNTLPPLKNTFAGYKGGPSDGNWYLDKYREYLKYGADEAPESRRNEDWIERA